MYQIVAIRLLDFYLVEDVDSRDAENEGLSLILQFKWLPQGIFWLVDGVKTPTKLRIYFGLSLLLPWVLSWNRAGGGICLIC